MKIPFFSRNKKSNVVVMHQGKPGPRESGQRLDTISAVEKLPWSLDEMSIGWLADTYVLGDGGIRPKFKDERATQAWLLHKVDSAQQMSMRDWERVILFQLLLKGENFLRWIGEPYVPGSRLMIETIPYEIKRDKQTNMPTSYIWKKEGKPDLVVEPKYVIHTYIHLFPGQERGVKLFDLVKELSEERGRTLSSIVQMLAILPKMLIWLKRKGANEGIHIEDGELKDEIGQVLAKEDGSGNLQRVDGVAKPTFDVKHDSPSFQEMGLLDEVQSAKLSSFPISATETEKLVGGRIWSAFGISRMLGNRDFSDVNFSSARLASIIDNATWKRYQHAIYPLVVTAYEVWNERPLYESSFDGWFIPRFPSIDMQKEATTYKILSDLTTISPQEIIRRQELDPETVAREIRDWRRMIGSDSDNDSSDN